MIRKLRLKNFCSFREATEIDFTAPESGGKESDAFVATSNGERITPLLGVVGAGASGKTNLLKALVFIPLFLRFSFDKKLPAEGIKIDPFFGDSRHEPVELALEFEGESGVYCYETELTSSGVLKESLNRRDSEGEFQPLLLREWREERDAEFVKDFGIGLNTAAVADQLPRGASVLCTAMHTGNQFLEDVYRDLGAIGTNVDRLGTTKSSDGDNEIFYILEATEFLQEDRDALAKLKDLLKRANPGFEDLEFRRYESADMPRHRKKEKFTIPFFNYLSDGEIVSLSILQESSGNKRLFVVFGKLFQTLRAGGIAVIDELDLNPQAVPFLLELFTRKETNPRQAQFIFSSHHPEGLSALKPDQTILIEKDDQCGSHARRLDQLAGIDREKDLIRSGRAAEEILVED